MFDSIRSHRRWLMIFLIVLVFPSFVFFGVQGYNRFVSDERAVARVAGQPITVDELDAAQRNRLEQLRRMLGANFDAKLFDTPAARAATLQALIADKALTQEAQRAHVWVSAERLRDVIAAVPAFQQDGRFSYERYKTLLAAQGQSEQSFEARVRADLIQQTLLRAVADSTVLPRAVAERLQAAFEEQREVRELRLRPEDFLRQVSITDEQVAAHYASHRREFETPESVRAEYLVLTLDDVAAQISVPEADLRAYYEQNRSRYAQEEQRRASHILFTYGPDGSAKDKEGARKLAEQTLARLRNAPGDFARLAKELSKDPGSAANGGDVGFFGRDMMVKPFEEAAFSLKEGELSGVVETDFGFHIIRLTAIRPARVKPFEEVRAEIEREFRRQQAQKKFAEAAETFTNTVYEQADSLQPAAEKLKLKVQTAERVTRQGAEGVAPQPPVFTPRVIEALFAADALKNRRNTEAIETAPNTLVAARVLEHRPAQVRPLAEVQGEIRARLERQEAIRLAKEAGQRRLAALRERPDVSGFSQPRTVSRLEPGGLPDGALKVVFQVPADRLPAFVGAELDGGTYAVIQVLSARMPEKPDAARREQLAQGWTQALAQGDDLAYLEALKRKYKTEILQSELRAADQAAK
ncbi:MAG: SurA N-terminal domain-containing protein [Burkholderiaceae bacterium]|nr:SurA N-terminal domain-containing protein [Burkholderiaceae bacterium]